MGDLMTPREVAALLRVSIATLARWRAAKTGPPFQKLGDAERSRVRYERSAVETWAAAK